MRRLEKLGVDVVCEHCMSLMAFSSAIWSACWYALIWLKQYLWQQDLCPICTNYCQAVVLPNIPGPPKTLSPLRFSATAWSFHVEFHRFISSNCKVIKLVIIVASSYLFFHVSSLTWTGFFHNYYDIQNWIIRYPNQLMALPWVNILKKWQTSLFWYF